VCDCSIACAGVGAFMHRQQAAHPSSGAAGLYVINLEPQSGSVLGTSLVAYPYSTTRMGQDITRNTPFCFHAPSCTLRSRPETSYPQRSALYR
jgi:hypothetical protein